MNSDCKHEYVYQGAVNFFRNKELLLVIESWVCRRCGLTRLGKRGPEYLSSTEGLYPPPEEGKRWYVLVCMAGEEPFIEAYQLKTGEAVPHECPAYPEKTTLVLGEDESVRLGIDGPPVGRHFIYRYEDIVKGYVELAKTPPEVITLTERRHA